MKLILCILVLLLDVGRISGRRRDRRDRDRLGGGVLGGGASENDEWFSPNGLNLIVHLNSRNRKSMLATEDALKLITFCIDCPSPEEEGSVATGLLPMHFMMRQEEYEITSQLVYCVPNHADSKELVNVSQVQGRIVLVDRGKNPLHEKVLRAQEAGAVGVIIADDGQCDEKFRFCGVRAGSVAEGGFAANDGADLWNKLKLPVYLVTKSTAMRIKNMMRLSEVNILGIGMQNITVLKPLVGPMDFEL